MNSSTGTAKIQVQGTHMTINQEKCAVKLRYFSQEKKNSFFKYKPKLERSKGKQPFTYEAAFHVGTLYCSKMCNIYVISRGLLT